MMRLWQKVLISIAVLLPVLSLLYRKTLYWKIPVVPGDPYGLGDIIDGGLGLLVVAGSAFAVLGGVATIMVPRFRNTRNAVVLVVVGIVSTLSYFWLRRAML